MAFTCDHEVCTFELFVEADVIEYIGGSSPARYRVSNTNDYTVQGGVWFAMAERLQPSEWAP